MLSSKYGSLIKVRASQKEKTKVLSDLNTRLHVVSERGHKDEFRLHGL
jgi:hypothetical protein